MRWDWVWVVNWIYIAGYWVAVGHWVRSQGRAFPPIKWKR